MRKWEGATGSRKEPKEIFHMNVSLRHLVSSLMMFIILSLLICLPYSSQSIIQVPPFLVLRPGDPVSLSCTVTGSDVPTIYWYRQGFNGGTPIFISLSVTTGSVDELTLNHFTGERNSGSLFNLKSEKITESDSGVYYCAWSRTEEKVDGEALQ